MKKLVLALLFLVLPVSMIACNSENTLSVLNWGEYINDDLVAQFEEEYGVTVKMTLADSNELMEQKIKSGTTKFDIVIPSDYMIEKLYDEGYLQQIDLTKLTNFDPEAFLPGIDLILNQMFVDNDDVATPYNVSIPYFWGVFGIMYNRTLAGLEAYVQDVEWAAIFEQEPVGMFTRALKVGIYDVPRFDYSASLIYAYDKGLITNANALNEITGELMDLSEDILGQREYQMWHTDQLKKDVEAGLLDLCFTYVGDFFDTFLLLTEEATTAEQAAALTEHIGIYVPANTMAFYDGMVIPANANNPELAHKFIDFFLDPLNAYENSSIVGYTTTLQATYDMIKNNTHGDIIRSVMVNNYPYNPATDESFAAKPLIAFTNDETDNISSMVNRVKTS